MAVAASAMPVSEGPATGVFDGYEEIGAAHPPHAYPGVQGAGRPGALREDKTIASRPGSSRCIPTRSLRRVKRLEEADVIASYVGLVRAKRVGLGLTAYINVRMIKQDGGDKRNPMEVFAAAVQNWPEVQECMSLTGDMDYLLKVIVADMDHYTRFVMDTLLKHLSVQDCRTSFVMRPYKSNVTLV